MRFFGFFLVCLLLGAQAVRAEGQDFSAWLQALRQEALTSGISEKTVREALPDTLQPLEKVVRLDRKQPESTKNFRQYLHDTLTPQRIGDGRERYRDNKSILYDVDGAYGVDAQYVVALWGIETNFGRNTGGFELIPALATLAYDGRRSAYFRGELLKALKILDEDHILLKDFKGSWAGAMGQTQFMPSSFFRFAQDYDKDGKRDIWKSKPDIFASAANYLAKSGWKHGEPWGRRVRMPENFDEALIGLDTRHTLQFWHDAGVRLKDGGSIPFEGSYDASLIRPDGPDTPAYIVYDNYRVILKWNHSVYFATAVGLLADRVKG